MVAPKRKRKMVAPSRNRAVKKVSQPINLAADMVSDAMFTEMELGQFEVLRLERDFVEVRCGVTSRKYGDYVGRVKICRDGTVRIACECFNGCTADNLTILEFEKHTKPPIGQSMWTKGPLWVFTLSGNRIPLPKTKLLKYYKESPNDSWVKIRPKHESHVHRNEWSTCTKCNKRRRFLCYSKETCKLYHDASLTENWTCADYPDNRFSCEDVDQRSAQINIRGCRKSLCYGCPSCVCFGCSMCRFEDCDCRLCVDFINNNGN